MQSDSQASDAQYVVVARRYRPQNFSDLVGQSQVATALTNAIEQNRVGHAYLFSGARGVGKTSSARIFAKCLNCHSGPTVQPCNDCDICLGIASGEDVDVLEIDGASNRGIDEIRQLRANAIVRPSRARFKIYIIDEVHMLTTPAFNALLKTLEEPPDHVKFIFCTTDPEKIPITVLSRCQRFDFPPIQSESIKERLQLIVAKENVAAEDEALELLARRAGGSMRDSQSLLEQLLSYATQSITVADVNALLGTADISCVLSIVDAIVAQDAAAALQQIDQAIADGVDPGQLTEQLLGLLRDIMANKVGCPSHLLIHTPHDDLETLSATSDRLGLENIIAMIQVLDQALIKMRYSNYVRTLLETAVVRACHLENIDLIPTLIEQLKTGTAPSGGLSAADSKRTSSKPTATVRKKNAPTSQTAPTKLTKLGPASPNPPMAAASPPASSKNPPARQVQWDEANLADAWRQVLDGLGDMTADVAANFESLSLAGDDRLVVVLKSTYDRDLCRRPERKLRLEQAIEESTGKKIRIDFQSSEAPQTSDQPLPIPMSKRQQIRQMEQQEFVRKAVELFDAEITDVKLRPS